MKWDYSKIARTYQAIPPDGSAFAGKLLIDVEGNCRITFFDGADGKWNYSDSIECDARSNLKRTKVSFKNKEDRKYENEIPEPIICFRDEILTAQISEEHRGLTKKLFEILRKAPIPEPVVSSV